MQTPSGVAPRRQLSVANCNVEISESPGKPLLLLVRMAARGMGVWDGVWDRLAEIFTVAQFDLPAPDLDRIEDPVEIFRNYAKICVDVAAGLGHQRFHIFGWTGGTHVATRCIIDHPDRVLSCVLLGPIGALPDNRPTEHGLDVQRLLLDKSLEAYTYSWIMSGLTWDYILDNYDQIEKIVKDRMVADKGRLDTERVFRWVKALRFPSYTEAELDRITTPTLIAVQGFDRWPSLAMARRLHGLIPSSELAIMHGSGALTLMEAPEKFMAVAGRFLHAAAAGMPAPARIAKAAQIDVLQKGRRTAVVEPRSSSAVVFLHGWLMSPGMWAGTMKALEGKARCVALWQPAHGASAAPPHGFSMDQWADWLADTLAALGIERAVLVGHSMGSFLAQAAARRHPGLVSALVLVGTQDTAWPRERNEEFASRVDAIAATWGPDTARLLAERLVGSRFLGRDAGFLGRWESAVRSYDLAGMAHLAHAIVTRPDFSQLPLPRDIPALVVHGGADVAIAPADGRATAKRLKGAKFVAVPDAGHCLPMEEPEAFAKILTAFLRKHGLPD